MSFTTTPNYALNKPTPGADDDLWGTHLNQNADILDTQLKTIDTKASAVPSPSDSPPTMDSTAAPGISIAFSRGDHRHPTDTTRYAASNPASYVNASQAAAAAPVQSVAGHTGTVTLTHTDITDWAANVPAGSTTLPLIEGTAAIGVSTAFARSDHVHPAGGGGGGASISISDTPPASPSHGDMWFDSVGTQLYLRYNDGSSAQWITAINQTTANGTVSGGATPYTLAGYVAGVLTASQVLLVHQAGTAIVFPANFGADVVGGSSRCGSSANASGTTVLTVEQCPAAGDPTVSGNYAAIGTLTFAASPNLHTATLATVGGTSKSIAAGDFIRVIGPSSADATLAGVFITLVGNR
jgi:hypothetical protein